jgi:hypothetical protein
MPCVRTSPSQNNFTAPFIVFLESDLGDENSGIGSSIKQLRNLGGREYECNSHKGNVTIGCLKRTVKEDREGFKTNG